MDNRNREKSELQEEIENDTSVIDEDSQKEEVTEDTSYEDSSSEEAEAINEEELDDLVKPSIKPPVQTQPDLEERYKEQRREAQILNERNKQLTEAFTNSDTTVEPTEQELHKAARIDGYEWDDLTMVEKSLLKKNFISERTMEVIKSAVKDVRSIDEWAERVDSFVDTNETDQKYKQLIGREAEFRAFTMKQTHRGLPIDMLVGYFLYTNEVTPKKKGSLFLTNTGGEKEVIKSSMEDTDSVANLRVSNPREYRRQLKAGKVKLEI